MIGTISPQFRKLTAAQRRLWPDLQPSVAMGFVLYGGPAVALYFGHRRSADFDLFSDQHLDRTAIRESFRFMPSSQVLRQARDTLVVSASGVTVAFFGGVKFGRVGDPVLAADGAVEVASLDDLLARKLMVITERAEKKDYEDIAAMLRAGVSLDYGLAAARALYGKAYQPAESLKALTWFGDGDLPELSRTAQRFLAGVASSVKNLPKVVRRSQSLSIRLSA